jgi:hypothetical protein
VPRPARRPRGEAAEEVCLLLPREAALPPRVFPSPWTHPQESELALIPPVKPGIVPEFKHVIDQYKHKEQTVTCVCGWHGSSVVPDGGQSEWTAHLVSVRGKKR